MKAGWEVKPLGTQCVALTKGTTPTSVGFKFLDNGINFIKVESLTDAGDFLEHKFAKIGEGAHDALKRSQLEVGDILFSIAGALGRTAIVPPNVLPANTNQALAVIRLSSDARISKSFLRYFLTSELMLEQIEKLKGGAAQQNLSLGQLKALEIPLPPLEEQKRIVAVLDAAFEGLTRARTHIETNLQNARELFENYREHYLPPENRQGWSYKKLEDIISIKHGFAFKSASFSDSGKHAVLTPGNYHETGGFRDRGKKQRFYLGEFPEEFLLRKGDLLVAMTEQAPGLLGSCVIVPEDDGYLHNQRLGLIAPKSGVAWSANYFSQAFNLKAFRKALSNTCSGATVRHTSPSRILAESVPYCNNIDELEAAALELNEREQDGQDLQTHYRAKLQDLDDLRQSLLQKAFAGELT